MKEQNVLYSTPEKVQKDNPVLCLGMTFENDATRREYFTEELRKKLQDPEFRKIEGFPLGEDKDILALSDPPYYCACPNPWLADFIAEWESQKPEKPEDYKYHREPFAADVSEGKNDPIYNAHSYHTKVPHKAIMRYILHYTEPGDIVFDGFCGTGMTGLAAQLCNDKKMIESLGYKVEKDGKVIDINIDSKKHFSQIGQRKSVINDLSPAATFIATNYNIPFDVKLFQKEAEQILKDIENEISWMYETVHSDGETKGRINYTVWSEIFICSSCGGDVVFVTEAFDIKNKKVKEVFVCPHCSLSLKKNDLELKFESVIDLAHNDIIQRPKRIPVLINYSVGKAKFEKKPDENDFFILEKIEKMKTSNIGPINPLPPMQMANVGRMKPTKTTHIHHFFLNRPYHMLNYLWRKVESVTEKRIRLALFWFVEQAIWTSSILNRFRPSGYSQVNQYMAGVFYVPSQHSEPSPWYVLKGKLDRLVKIFSQQLITAESSIINTGDCSKTMILPNSVDYIFVDPPFGENIYYSDLNYLVESWHKVITRTATEAIIDKVKNKDCNDYRTLMTNCFKEAYRILKPGRWMTVEFSNTKAAIWNSIQTALSEAGFIIANISALDKKQGTFQAVNSPTAVKQDLVISAYKPNGGFEERFEQKFQSEEGVWEFIRTHLSYLPVTKKQDNVLVPIPERDPRLLYDQVIAYYVRKGYNLPIDSQDFQNGLSQRFAERDNMYFLSEQVAEYDRKKMLSGLAVQESLFVSDEASAIAWLRKLLREKPQSFQDINPLFMKELSGWSKNEKGLELSTLLEQNFLMYDGTGLVPEQIHAYLSTNWKDMRNLPKDDPALIAKAKGRWYLPDPNKAGDLEKLREKALLKEFEEYKEAKKKLKIFRIEAVRAGFKKAYQERDYSIIIAVAEKIPSNILEEDPKLLMWYDQAVTRVGDA